MAETDPHSEPVSLERARVKAALRKQLFAKDDDPIKVGRFVITEKLGAGGMGIVYAAFDPKLKREVAIKLVRFGAEDEDQRLRLEREAQAMARLDHPNVLPVYEVGEHDDQVFVAMQLVKGQTLRAWVEGKSWSQILAVYRAAARGLAAAHDAGLVHRDFKPENVMVAEDTEMPRVMDFGLARSSEDGPSPHIAGSLDTTPGDLDTPLTRTGSLLGTPAYMSPEQHRGQTADASSDQFSFCVALWEALYEQRPFAGDSFAALQQAVLDGAMETPVRGTVPAWVEPVLRRGLAVEADDRYASMTELLAALDPPASWLGRLGWLGAAAGLAGLIAFGAVQTPDPVPTPAPVVLDRPGATLCIDPPNMTERWHAWEPTLDTLVEGLHEFGVEQLHEDGRKFAQDWDSTVGSVCATDVPSRPAQLECLQDRVETFEATQRILEALPDTAARRAAIWSLPKPKVCEKEDPAYDAPPAGDAEQRRKAWDERVQATVMATLVVGLQSSSYDPGDLSDPVAQISVETFRMMRDRIVVPSTTDAMSDEQLTEVEDLLARAEAAGARRVAAGLMVLRLLSEINNGGLGLRAGGLLAALRVAAEKLDDDLLLSIDAGSHAATAKTPQELQRLFGSVLERLDHPRTPGLYLDNLALYRIYLLGLGAVEEVIALNESELPQWVAAEEDSPVIRHLRFGRLHDDLYQRAARRQRDSIAVEDQLAHDWLAWDRLEMSETRARQILAIRNAEEPGAQLQLRIAMQLRELDRARQLLDTFPAGGLRDAYEMELLELEGRTTEAAERAQRLPKFAVRFWFAQRAPILARAGKLELARAMLETVTVMIASRSPQDLEGQAPRFFQLAQVLHQLGPQHHDRAVRMARNALAMYELGGGDLWDRDRAEIRRWLAKAEAPPSPTRRPPP